MTSRTRRPADQLEPLRSEQWLTEARRKAIHLSFIVLPLELLLEWLPWPRGRGEFRLLFLALTAGATLLDVLRIHERRVRTFFRQGLRRDDPRARAHEPARLHLPAARRPARHRAVPAAGRRHGHRVHRGGRRDGGAGGPGVGAPLGVQQVARGRARLPGRLPAACS